MVWIELNWILIAVISAEWMEANLPSNKDSWFCWMIHILKSVENVLNSKFGMVNEVMSLTKFLSAISYVLPKHILILHIQVLKY